MNFKHLEFIDHAKFVDQTHLFSSDTKQLPRPSLHTSSTVRSTSPPRGHVCHDFITVAAREETGVISITTTTYARPNTKSCTQTGGKFDLQLHFRLHLGAPFRERISFAGFPSAALTPAFPRSAAEPERGECVSSTRLWREFLWVMRY